MCGIVGAVAKRSVAQLLIEGLKKLEYRGYDSAGIAVIDHDQDLKRLRVVGKVRELEHALSLDPLNAFTGIAHTRWATHGEPSEKNAHPLLSNDAFALVHNGIIENHGHIREQLMKQGYQFYSDTDTEVIVHLIHNYYSHTNNLLQAVRLSVKDLRGAYSLGILSKHHPNRLIAVRQGSPLVIGRGKSENFIASDPLALLSLTQQFIYLEDNDIADVTLNNIEIYNAEHRLTKREQHTLLIHREAVERGPYRHYMQKEILEQPQAITACLEGRLTKEHVLPAIFGPKAESILSQVEHIHLIACGTSYHAAMVARYWFEELCHIPCMVEVASEFRYRSIALPRNCLFLSLSQSGETADTLAALRLAKKMDYLSSLAICNVSGSSLTREADAHFLTHAGIEIGVASTKSFLTQLTALLLLALAINTQKKQALPSALTDELLSLPLAIKTLLEKQDQEIIAWSRGFINKAHALFMGRGSLYPIALEGALKMKELSYIHAEAYPAGELKHGPLALVDTNMPIVTTLPHDHLFEKTLSNLQEVRARGGLLYVLTDKPALLNQKAFQDAQIIEMPETHPLLTPIMYTLPLQLLAYHVAVLKGTDVDQPRNLAKSVTVE